MSLKRIHLHGELGQLFGEQWQLDVVTPAEAVCAINANRPGFTKHLVESGRQGTAYQMLLGDDLLGTESLGHPFSCETFHLVPVLVGANQNGASVAKVVVGAVIVIASMGYGAAAYGGAEGATMGEVMEGGFMGAAMSQPALLGMSYGTIALMGASIAFSGISALLSKSGVTPASATDGSHSFSGPVNTVAQGGPIPIGYGELVVGSTVISAGIKVSDEATS